ncbi:MAG: aminotransferase class IV [Pseudomonadota bacterium]
MTYWLNGEFRQGAHAIDIADRGFLLGDGVFETVLVRNGTAAFLDDHLARLQKGLSALHISAGAPADLEEIISILIKKNGIDGDASLRLTISRGPSGRGLAFPDAKEGRPTLLVTVRAAPEPLPEAVSPLSLMASQHRRFEHSVTTQHKTLNYLDNILARNEALGAGADEAVMLNSKDRVACASSANIFVIDDQGAVQTPSVEEGALPGIVRGVLLRALGRIDVEMREAPLDVQALHGGHVFLTNSLIGVRPAAMLGATGVWPAAPLKILQRLQSWYEASFLDSLSLKAPTQ